MNASDAMIMTSLIEGAPNVVKEVMACDLPIIGVPVGDVEQLLDRVTGCHVCPRDARIIGKQLARTLKSPDCDGRNAIIARGLDLKSVARRIVAEYEKALGEIADIPTRQSLEEKDH